MAIGDILAGLAEASHQHETNLLNMAHEDRTQKARLFADLATNPNYSPEQQAWFGKAALAHATGAKEAKQYEIKDGQIKVPVEIMQPKPANVEQPQPPPTMANGVPTGAEPYTLDAPTPPPLTVQRDVMQPMSYAEMTAQQAARAAAVSAAQAQTKPAPNVIRPFGNDSSGLYNETTGSTVREPTPPPGPKVTFQSKVGTVDGKPAVADYDPVNKKYYVGDKDVTGKFMPKEAELSLAEREAADWIAKNPGKDYADYEKYKASLGNEKSEEGRVQTSYQFHVQQLAALSKPIDDKVARFSVVHDTLSQNNPVADAFIAPELLTLMAGGQGSGLRMNEAEIARIVGGRSGWETLKAQIQHWRIDPDSARSITKDQDRMIRAMIQTVGDKVEYKQTILATAQQAIASATTTQQHKDALVTLRKMLNSTDRGNYPVLDPKGKIHEFDSREQAEKFAGLLPQ